MKQRLILAIMALSAFGHWPSAAIAGAKENIVENATAAAASEKICGFKVNQDVLLITMQAVGVSPKDLRADGMYADEVSQHRERISRLTATEPQRRSFCSTIKAELSAIFD
jgi:uncharacterized protein (DUF342 family)